MQDNDIGPSTLEGNTAEELKDNMVTTQINGKNPTCLLRAVTWGRESHGLFDYESRNIQKKNLRLNVSGKIVREQTTVDVTSINKELNEEQKALVNIVREEDKYYLDQPQTQGQLVEPGDRQWLVVRSLKTPDGKIDYKIQPHDIVKLGRVKFRVKEFKTDLDLFDKN